MWLFGFCASYRWLFGWSVFLFHKRPTQVLNFIGCPRIINYVLSMLAESAIKTSSHFTPILPTRRNRNYDQRQKLSLSVISLIPSGLRNSIWQSQGLRNKLAQKQRRTMVSTMNGDIGTNSFIICNLHKKSSQKQRKDFNKLKANNQAATHKISQIIFKSQMDQIVATIQKKALIPRPKQNAPFKLSHACIITQIPIQNRYVRRERPMAYMSQRSKSANVRRTKSLKATAASTFKSLHQKALRKQQLKGWEPTSRRYLTHYEENADFDYLL